MTAIIEFMRRISNARTYIIEFKDGTIDGTIKIIDSLDIAIPAAGRIHSTSTQEVLANGNFLAFRTHDGRDTVLISADTVKSIQITDERKSPGEFINEIKELI